MPPKPPSAGSPVFLLGLGAQKCGTTWLHRYLAGQPNFNGGFAKEYHVWDALDIRVMAHKRGRFWHVWQGRKKAERYLMQRNPDRYFDYFAGLLTTGANRTADITPAYSGLGQDRMIHIRDQFAARGIHTRAIILVRDPLGRIRSAVRYNLRKRNYNEGIRRGESDFLVALRQYYTSEECRMRTSYQVTIPNALSAFGADNTYVGVYENMFEPSQITRLSEFCGVSDKPELAEVFVKRTDGEMAEDTQLEMDIRAAYSDTYAYCHENLPETRALWAQ